MATSAPRPPIAVTCDHETKTDHRGAQAPRYWLSEGYVRAVHRAGADAYLLPFVDDLSLEDAHRLLQPMRALVVTGGAFDIDPERYGQQRHAKCGVVNPARTHFEAVLLAAARQRQLPTLGICGGMQLMVVEAGGTLHQDVSLRPNTGVHEQPFDKAEPSHEVLLQPGSRVHQLSAAAVLRVNSTHHQVVDGLGQLRAVGHSPDGVVEAVEDAALPFYLGVQWHPEALRDDSGQGLYDGLAAAARATMV